MKHALVWGIAIGFTSTIAAETLINADGTIESQICIDATKTSLTLDALQIKYKLSSHQFNSMACNGMPIQDFAKKYQERKEVADKLKVFTFSKEVGNVETELCIAAATSNEVLKIAMEKHNTNKMFVAKLNCNDLPIKTFAKKYGNKQIAIP